LRTPGPSGGGAGERGLLGEIGLLIACLILCQVAGGIGAVATYPSIPTWYAGLVKPSFNPPNWVFGPVWTTLYFMMGVALFLVWKRPKSRERDRVVALFFVQLALNSLWSILFFGLHQPWLAFADILLLWGGILAFILSSFRLSTASAGLMVPYLLWVSFATMLNLAIAHLNR
jgi:benzodiazapine receptor